MLHRTSVALLRVAAVALVVLGAASFAVPVWASENFPWKVGPFLAMTIGGWSLGTAAYAWDAARDLHPVRTLPLVTFLWLFAVGELLVVMLFADRLLLGAPLTYPYLISLGALLVAGVTIAAEWRRRGADVRGRGAVAPWMRWFTLGFALFVLGLTAGTLIAGPDGVVARGEFFPEPLGLFSIRAFAAFFFAIAGSALVLLVARETRPFTVLTRAGLYLIVPITIAALVNLGRFDFVGRLGSLIYLAAYVIVGVILAARLWWVRTRGPAPVTDPLPGGDAV
jgi:hypothetical protein